MGCLDEQCKGGVRVVGEARVGAVRRRDAKLSDGLSDRVGVVLRRERLVGREGRRGDEGMVRRGGLGSRCAADR